MRRERIRVYTEASGPLYFGRVDRADGETLYVGRHAIHSPTNDLLAINWRAPAAEPFYAATERDPQGLRPAPARHRGPPVLGFVDEPLRHAVEDHLTDAIVEDITRQRVGEMRQIISTITPDQYELIGREAQGALVIQGGPGTGRPPSACTARPGCCTRTRSSAARACWSSARTRRSSSTSSRSSPRSARAPSSSARSARWSEPARRDRRDPGARHAQGQRPDRRRPAPPPVGPAQFEDIEIPVSRRGPSPSPPTSNATWSPPCGSAPSPTRPGGSASANAWPARSPRACSPQDSLASPDDTIKIIRKTKEYTRRRPRRGRRRRRRASSASCSRTAPGWRGSRATCSTRRDHAPAQGGGDKSPT